MDQDLANKFSGLVDRSRKEHETAALVSSLCVDERFMDKVKAPVDEKDAAKCPRCYIWHRMTLNYDNLCDYCCKTLVENFPNHESVSGIKEAYRKQRELWQI